jgi:Phosphoglycerate dehydrogenase and related dehydrogenases
MKIIISNQLSVREEDINKLKEAGYEVGDSFDKVTASDADVIVGSIESNEKSLENFPNLKFIHILSAGFDKYDLEAMKNRNIIMVNGRGVYSRPIAEYILGKVLVWAKKDHTFYDQQKRNEWKRYDAEMLELSGKVVGIFGTGSIGKETARLFQAFECKVLGVNTSGKAVEYFDETFAMEDKEIVLKQSDIIVCTLPLSDATYHLFGKQEFLTMKKDALFINIGRGKEVNEAELLEVLDTHLSLVVMDVFEVEPLPKESPLWQHSKVIVTPHNSADSDIVDERQVNYVIRNLLNYIKNEELENRII